MICVFFLSDKLTNPSYAAPGADREVRSSVQPERLGLSALQVLRKNGSSASLNSLTSIIDPSTGEGHVRVCFYCKQVRIRRER